MSKEYDSSFLSFYSSFTTKELKKTVKKYKCYAKHLGHKCDNLRTQVAALYSKLNDADVLNFNAHDVSVKMDSELRRLDKQLTEAKPRPPWCRSCDPVEEAKEISNDVRGDDVYSTYIDGEVERLQHAKDVKEHVAQNLARLQVLISETQDPVTEPATDA